MEPLRAVRTCRYKNDRWRCERCEGPWKVVARGIDGRKLDDGRRRLRQRQKLLDRVKSPDGGRAEAARRRHVEKQERPRTIEAHEGVTTEAVKRRLGGVVPDKVFTRIGAVTFGRKTAARQLGHFEQIRLSVKVFDEL